MNTFLVGEVGLQQTNIKIVRVKSLSYQTTIVNEANLDNKDYNSFLHLLTEFLNGNTSHSKAIIIVPGIVRNNRLDRKIGLCWKSIDGLELAKALQIPFFRLVNKVESISLYSKFLRMTDTIELNAQYVPYTDKKLFVYLGEEVQTSIIVSSSPHNQTGLSDQKVVLSAISLNSFCPKNSKDFEFQLYLQSALELKGNQIASFQNMLSTRGILNVYCFLSDRCKIEIPNKFNYKVFISELKKGSKIAVETVDYYMEILGNFIYTACAAYLPEGGTYLFGSDFCKMASYLRDKSPETLKIISNHFLVDGHLKPRFSEFRLSVCTGEPDIDFDQVIKHL
jgi:glucokinase